MVQSEGATLEDLAGSWGLRAAAMACTWQDGGQWFH